MPTARPRHLITETGDVAAALDIAAALWPDLSRPQLLVKLAVTAAEPLAAQARQARQLAAIDRQEVRGRFGRPALRRSLTLRHRFQMRSPQCRDTGFELATP